MRFLKTDNKAPTDLDKILFEEQQLQLQMSSNNEMMAEEPIFTQPLHLSKNESFSLRQYDPDFSYPFGSGLQESGEMSLEAGFGVSGGASGGAFRDNHSNQASLTPSGQYGSGQFGEFGQHNQNSNLTRSEYEMAYSSNDMNMEKEDMCENPGNSQPFNYSGKFSMGGESSEPDFRNSSNRIFEEERLPPAEDNIFGEKAGSGLMPDTYKRSLPPKKGGCSCGKTRCLKYYCDCFKNGSFCDGRCGCKNCKNIPENTDYIKKLHRYYCNKLKQDEEEANVGDYVCNCKKSFCENNYCPCHRSGRGCIPGCKCYNCKNVHGLRKAR